MDWWAKPAPPRFRTDLYIYRRALATCEYRRERFEAEMHMVEAMSKLAPELAAGHRAEAEALLKLRDLDVPRLEAARRNIADQTGGTSWVEAKHGSG